MSLKHKVKEGLDETRLLILGAQVLFGFKLTSVFQECFAQLSHATRLVDCAGQFLMALAIGLLIAPSMQHHIAEKGREYPPSSARDRSLRGDSTSALRDQPWVEFLHRFRPPLWSNSCCCRGYRVLSAGIRFLVRARVHSGGAGAKKIDARQRDNHLLAGKD